MPPPPVRARPLRRAIAPRQRRAHEARRSRAANVRHARQRRAHRRAQGPVGATWDYSTPNASRRTDLPRGRYVVAIASLFQAVARDRWASPKARKPERTKDSDCRSGPVDEQVAERAFDFHVTRLHVLMDVRVGREILEHRVVRGKGEWHGLPAQKIE